MWEIPRWGRFSGEGNGNPLQYSCLENPMDGGAWQATVHGVAKSWTWRSNFTLFLFFGSVQWLSCIWLCDPMDCSTPGFPVHHHLPELAQTHVHWVSDAIQPSHPLPSPSPPALYLSQHHGLFPVSWLFASGGQSTGVSASASALPMKIQDIWDILHKIFVKYFM